jgi:hypothetical protein
MGITAKRICAATLAVAMALSSLAQRCAAHCGDLCAPASAVNLGDDGYDSGVPKLSYAYKVSQYTVGITMPSVTDEESLVNFVGSITPQPGVRVPAVTSAKYSIRPTGFALWRYEMPPVSRDGANGRFIFSHLFLKPGSYSIDVEFDALDGKHTVSFPVVIGKPRPNYAVLFGAAGMVVVAALAALALRMRAKPNGRMRG